MDWRRLWHAVGQGLTTQAAASVAHEHQTLAAALRSRQSRPRRIAVLGATGGVGTTTVAVLLASVVAAARDDQTLLFGAHGDGSDAAARLAMPHAPSVTTVLAGLRRQGRIPPTPVTPNGVRVLAGPEPGTAFVGTAVAPLVEVAATGHACVVMDAGAASHIADLTCLADLVDTVVLVCATTPDAVHATSRLLARWVGQEWAGAPPPRLVLVPVQSRGRTASRGIDPLQKVRAAEDRAHVLPHDRELARGQTIDLKSLSGTALTALLVLAADIMGSR